MPPGTPGDSAAPGTKRPREAEAHEAAAAAERGPRPPPEPAPAAEAPGAAEPPTTATAMAGTAAAAAAWAYFKRLGAPKWHVAPMVDQSELAFRMLCRRHGATLAYSPMIHSRLFVESPKYREEIFTTCGADRPLLVQFCANDPDTLLAAAKLVEDRCDGVDLNLGCPQRIAKRGGYGAFLMDDLPKVERMVRLLAANLKVPVTCKIRKFPELRDTLAYARMLERAGCQLLAVHGRTRDQKNAKEWRADWDAIKAVREHVAIPVLANGDVRSLDDARRLMRHTGAVGVLSAEPLLRDPALFSPALAADGARAPDHGCRMMLEYLELCEAHPTPQRMVRGHCHKLLGPWFQEHHDLRDKLNAGGKKDPRADFARVKAVAAEMLERVQATVAAGRTAPIPKLSEKKRLKLEKEAARQAAIAEQEREQQGLDALARGRPDEVPV